MWIKNVRDTVFGAQMIRSFLLAGIAAAHASFAFAAGNAEAGRLLTQRWCSSCHPTPGGTVASDMAPSFVSVAKMHKDDPTWVKAWLSNPHPPMEGITLTRQQIDDVTVYLQSLSAVNR